MIARLLVLALTGGEVCSAAEHQERLEQAAQVFREVMEAPDRIIPQELLHRAECVAIIPGMKKGAFMFGARYGKGYIACRKENGFGWSAPGTVRIEGGSFGFQIGGSESDIILAVMNKRGADRLLSSQFTLGAGGAVAAGPIGRMTKAQTDALLTAHILSWSRTRGVFAGVSLQGATLRQALDDNRELYGRPVENRDIVREDLPIPAPAGDLISLLNKYSGRH